MNVFHLKWRVLVYSEWYIFCPCLRQKNVEFSAWSDGLDLIGGRWRCTGRVHEILKHDKIWGQIALAFATPNSGERFPRDLRPCFGECVCVCSLTVCYSWLDPLVLSSTMSRLHTFGNIFRCEQIFLRMKLNKNRYVESDHIEDQRSIVTQSNLIHQLPNRNNPIHRKVNNWTQFN